MKITLLLLLLLSIGLGACQSPNPTTKTKTMDATINFTEGTVRIIDKQKVMFANIMLQDYTAQDGSAKEGLAASLSLPKAKGFIIAGEGYVFDLEGKSYEVIEIVDGSGKRGRGTVTIKEIKK